MFMMMMMMMMMILSGTHFLRLSSEATHCLFSNLG